MLVQYLLKKEEKENLAEIIKVQPAHNLFEQERKIMLEA